MQHPFFGQEEQIFSGVFCSAAIAPNNGSNMNYNNNSNIIVC